VFTQTKKEWNPDPHLLHSASAPFLSFFITSSSPDFLLIGGKRGLTQRKAASSLAVAGGRSDAKKKLFESYEGLLESIG